MSPRSSNRVADACIAEAIATELAAAAAHHLQEERTDVAEVLLRNARRQRVRAILLRALSGAEHYKAISTAR
jgi:hypothetical protein